MSSGLVRELYDHVSSISRDLPEFRIASALMIVGACAQRSREFPGEVGTNLNICLVGPSSTTKTFFLNFIQKYLAAVAPELVCPGFASEIGFQEVMGGCPSRCLAQDEIGQKIEAAYIEKREAAQSWVQGLLKYSEPTDMPAQIRRAGTVAGVEHAVLSIAGAMTSNTLTALMSRSKFITDGLASRFLFFVHEDMLEVSTARRPSWKPLESAVKVLRREFQSTAVALDVDAGSKSHSLKNRKKLTDSQDLVRLGKDQFVANTKDQFSAFEKDQKELINSVRDRMVTTVEKIAQIHAIGRGADDIALPDVEFAVALTNWLWQSTAKQVLGLKDEETLIMEDVMTYFRGGDRRRSCTFRLLKTNGPRRVKSAPISQIKQLVNELISDNLLKIEKIGESSWITLSACHRTESGGKKPVLLRREKNVESVDQRLKMV